jgi:flagellar assembly protein FliH
LAEEVECASGRGTRPEPRVSRPEGAVLAPLATPELRTGVWTRFGANSVLGDAVTEETLSALAESTRTAARSQGYAVGWAEGRRAAREQADAVAEATEAARREAEDVRAREHAAAVAALELAAARLHEAVDGLCATVEHQASGLAWELTQELVGHELRAVTGPDVVRRALALAPTDPIVRLHLHPDQASDLSEADRAELAEHGTAVVADASLGWGDALVETADHVVDLRFRTALERVREVLA